ncbi:SRPBCC family protein [Candidatus Nitrosotenuis aquarius]|uniref:SRPBCC family protein n=1 Tax=Candidatus Nitrosotenuis aquarius TaxID=1846278 RepID=UPI000C1EDD11|nr:SRPBCC family protein [Candidatus Nitrosotenuis aquarius]
MAKLEFTINLPAESTKLFKLATDFENFRKYFPHLIKSITISEKNESTTTTQEIFTFTSFIKHEIKQKSIHKVIEPNRLETKIIEGPFKGSILYILYDKMESGTKVVVTADLKIALKYRILSSPIKNSYRQFLTGLLYKMNTEALAQ